MIAPSLMEPLTLFWRTTGLAHMSWDSALMLGVGGVLIAVAIRREWESLFLFALGFSILLAHLPGSTLAEPGGLLYGLYEVGIRNGLLPALLCLGLGVLADFGPLIAMPSLLLVGAAAQTGIFVSLWIALVWQTGLTEAAAMGLVGGANLPSLVFGVNRLAPDWLGTMVVALYACMALMPLLQIPIARLLTTEQERQVGMAPLRPVSRWERIFFPFLFLLPSLLLLPAIAPLLGLLAFGNLLKESGIAARLTMGLNPTMQTGLLPLITLLLGLAVGGKMSAERFFSLEMIGILGLGVVAFGIGSMAAVLMGKWLYRRTGGQVNPLVGVAGLAMVPLAARLAHKLGVEAAPDVRQRSQHPLLLTYAMGVNMAGVIGSIVAAGILLTALGGR